MFVTLVIGSTSAADLKPFVGGRISFGLGTFGDGNSVPNTALGSDPMTVSLGLKWNSFSLGAIYEYTRVWQTDSPEAVSNQDVSGSNNTYGYELAWVGELWGAGLQYRHNKYKFDQSSLSGATVLYDGHGYGAQIFRRWRGPVGVFFEYAVDNFYQSTTQSLNPNIVSKRYGLGVVISSFWNKKAK